MREKHGVERKGWIKVHIAVDVETRRPITFEITDERVADHEMIKPLLKDVKLKGSLMDEAYDKEEVFKFVKEKGVAMPGIKIRITPSSRLIQQEQSGFLNSKSMVTIVGRWFMAMVGGGLQRVFSPPLRGSSARL